MRVLILVGLVFCLISCQSLDKNQKSIYLDKSKNYKAKSKLLIINITAQFHIISHLPDKMKIRIHHSNTLIVWLKIEKKACFMCQTVLKLL